jgi:hypothetical protein
MKLAGWRAIVQHTLVSASGNVTNHLLLLSCVIRAHFIG